MSWLEQIQQLADAQGLGFVVIGGFAVIEHGHFARVFGTFNCLKTACIETGEAAQVSERLSRCCGTGANESC